MVVRSVAMGLLCSVACLAGCGGGEPSAAEPRAGGEGQAAEVDPEKALALTEDADKARKRKKFDEARALLRQADPIANVPVRDEIRLVADRVDRDEAEALAADAVELAKSGECGKALDDTAALLRLPGKGSTFAAHLLRATLEGNLACLTAMVDGGKLRDVKLLAGTKSAKQALGDKGYQSLEAKIEEATTALVMKAVDEPVQAKRWADAAEALRAMAKRGDATAAEVAPAMQKLGKLITDELTELCNRAIGQPRGASDALAEFDKLAAVLWTTKGASGANPQGAAALEPGPMPPAVATLRSSLAFWVACASVRCSEATPRKLWTYGNAALTPVLDPRAKPIETVNHGTVLWEIATAPGLTLVAKKEPGTLTGIGSRAAHAWGWLQSRDVRPEDTAEWLPPGDSLVGTRVWGPLRDSKDPLLEIGTVTAIERGQAKIRRMADREEVLVPRGRLYFGAVKPGMRILALCGGSLTPVAARVESVKETKFEAQGDPVVKLTCLDDKEQPTSEVRNDQMGSVRTKAEWLPRAR